MRAAHNQLSPSCLHCAAAVLRRLREALHEAGEAAAWLGWMSLNDTSHPCQWSGVACAPSGSIVKL